MPRKNRKPVNRESNALPMIIYIHIYIGIYICIYVYIYMYIHLEEHCFSPNSCIHLILRSSSPAINGAIHLHKDGLERFHTIPRGHEEPYVTSTEGWHVNNHLLEFRH